MCCLQEAVCTFVPRVLKSKTIFLLNSKSTIPAVRFFFCFQMKGSLSKIFHNFPSILYVPILAILLDLFSCANYIVRLYAHLCHILLVQTYAQHQHGTDFALFVCSVHNSWRIIQTTKKNLSNCTADLRCISFINRILFCESVPN